MKPFPFRFITCIFLSCFSFGQYASGLDHVQEGFIDHVFVPPVGYDDNDRIQLVLDGKLPNLCFELAQNHFDVNQKEKIITIQQFIKRKQIPECLTKNDKLPGYLKWPEPFTTEVHIGTLSEGNYRIRFQSALDSIQERVFQVKKSSSSSIDEMLYAPISDAFIPEIVYETENGEFVLTGIWQSSCLDLHHEDIQVETFSDVFVVLPKMTVQENTDCFRQQRPLREIVSLGSLKQGRYLLHIRSLTGKSINKVFTVMKSDVDPRMHHLQ
jgi:hypothetical protein